MAVTIKPLEDRILVQPLEAEQVSEVPEHHVKVFHVLVLMNHREVFRGWQYERDDVELVGVCTEFVEHFPAPVAGRAG